MIQLLEDYITINGTPDPEELFFTWAHGNTDVMTTCSRGHKYNINGVFYSENLYVAQGNKWSCGNCILEWKRARTPIIAGDIYHTTEEWNLAWAQHVLEADPGKIHNIKKKLAIRAAERVRTIEKEEAKGIVVNSSIKQDLIARYALPYTINKTNITADSLDAAIITGLPSDTEVLLDETSLGTVIDEVDPVNVTASTPGDYVIRLAHPYYFKKEVRINAD